MKKYDSEHNYSSAKLIKNSRGSTIIPLLEIQWKKSQVLHSLTFTQRPGAKAHSFYLFIYLLPSLLRREKKGFTRLQNDAINSFEEELMTGLFGQFWTILRNCTQILRNCRNVYVKCGSSTHRFLFIFMNVCY